MEQFDDILRTFINERHKFENRFDKVLADQEKLIAVKKLMLERLLNFYTQWNDDFARWTSSYHRPTRSQQSRKNIDTSVPVEIGMAAKDDGENSREEGDQRIMDNALQAVYKKIKKNRQRKVECQKGSNRNAKAYPGGKDANCVGVLMAEGQRQERRQRKRETWQWRQQSALDV